MNTKPNNKVSEQGNQRQAVSLEYLAGIIDGEGCIRLARQAQRRTTNKQYSAGVQVGMVEKIIPELLQATFGGAISEERVPNRRSIWRWNLRKQEDVLRFLKTIRSRLIVKKPQADLLIEFIEGYRHLRLVKDGNESILKGQELQRREEFYQKMKKLNAVGAAATTNRTDA